MPKKTKKPTYEVLRDGKPVDLTDPNVQMELFVAFTPSFFNHIAVATFPKSMGLGKDGLRAVTCAVDEEYIDTLVDAVEKRWPSTAQTAPQAKPKAQRKARRSVD